MAGDLNIGLASQAQNPPGVFSIRTQNRDFNTTPLDSGEARLFEEQFNSLVNDFDSRLVSELFLQRADIVSHALAHAKQSFDERRFGGINASDNEIAFDVIRPGHVRADPDTGDVVNSWDYTHTDGWNNWIGDGTSPNNYTVDEDQVVVVLGLMDSGMDVLAQDTGTLTEFHERDTTLTTAINVNRFGRNVDMVPKDLHDARLGDNKNEILVQALPTMIGEDRDELHARLRSDVPDELGAADVRVASEPRILGVTFGVGSFMNQEDF